jgi:uncharacterized protein (DUF1499 family)
MPMNAVSPEPRWPALYLLLARYAAIVTLVFVIAAGPGVRWHLISLEVAMNVLLVVAALAALAAFFFGGAALLASRAGRQAQPRVLNWLAFLFGGAVLACGAYGYAQLTAAPMLYDVSTDTAHPPVLLEVRQSREAEHAVNAADYVADYTVGTVAINAPEEQQRAYPDIRPVLLRMKPNEAFAAAEKAARGMGWQLVAVVPAEGRIEATDTTLYFGLKDDVAIRVRSEHLGRGSVVDVRSSSRFGANDAGANARRIRAFSERLRHPSS